MYHLIIFSLILFPFGFLKNEECGCGTSLATLVSGLLPLDLKPRASHLAITRVSTLNLLLPGFTLATNGMKKRENLSKSARNSVLWLATASG